MAFAPHNHEPSKIPERRFLPFQIVVKAREFGIERLFGNVAPTVERIERVGKAIIERRETRNCLPEGSL